MEGSDQNFSNEVNRLLPVLFFILKQNLKNHFSFFYFCYNKLAMEKYFIISYGCQMNKSDAERIASVLQSLGYKESKKEEEADILIALACSVRQSAVDRVYARIRKWNEFKKRKPVIIVLSGCLLSEDRKRLAEKVDILFDICDLYKLPKLLSNRFKELPDPDYFHIHPSYSTNFQAYVPIMTGCNNFCSYCVVPFTRGRERSRPKNEIIEEVKQLVKKGYKEITLLGQNVNSYKSGSVRFPDLLKLINKIEGNFWIRFLTSHPKDMGDDLIEAVAILSKVTEYIHLPVQSGDDEILKKMNRGYKVKDYLDLVKKIRKKIKGVAISTDIIVGFPGETRKQFLNTKKLMEKVKFDMAYIARYSERPQTAAAKLEDNVSPQEKKRREKILTNVLKKTALFNNKKYLGKVVEVLIDSEGKGFFQGKTRTFKNVRFKKEARNSLLGKFVKVKIKKAAFWGLEGELIDIL